MLQGDWCLGFEGRCLRWFGRNWVCCWSGWYACACFAGRGRSWNACHFCCVYDPSRFHSRTLTVLAHLLAIRSLSVKSRFLGCILSKRKQTAQRHNLTQRLGSSSSTSATRAEKYHSERPTSPSCVLSSPHSPAAHNTGWHPVTHKQSTLVPTSSAVLYLSYFSDTSYTSSTSISFHTVFWFSNQKSIYPSPYSPSINQAYLSWAIQWSYNSAASCLARGCIGPVSTRSYRIRFAFSNLEDWQRNFVCLSGCHSVQLLLEHWFQTLCQPAVSPGSCFVRQFCGFGWPSRPQRHHWFQLTSIEMIDLVDFLSSELIGAQAALCCQLRLWICYSPQFGLSHLNHCCSFVSYGTTEPHPEARIPAAWCFSVKCQISQIGCFEAGVSPSKSKNSASWGCGVQRQLHRGCSLALGGQILQQSSGLNEYPCSLWFRCLEAKVWCSDWLTHPGFPLLLRQVPASQLADDRPSAPARSWKDSASPS